MSKLLSKLAIGGAALLLTIGVAVAQTAPQAPPAAQPKAPVTKAAEPAKTEAAVKGVPKKATTPEGIECSKQADEKKLHGKERKKFRNKCISDLKKASGAAPAKKN